MVRQSPERSKPATTAVSTMGFFPYSPSSSVFDYLQKAFQFLTSSSGKVQREQLERKSLFFLETCCKNQCRFKFLHSGTNWCLPDLINLNMNFTEQNSRKVKLSHSTFLICWIKESHIKSLAIHMHMLRIGQTPIEQSPKVTSEII